MKLDIIIPTYNRQVLLEKTLQSILKAAPPKKMEFAVTVVDNNSQDETRKLVENHIPAFSQCNLILNYIFEKKQGISQARNAGIKSTGGDLIGFIDDDEEIFPDWILTVEKNFADETLDFIGGPYEPNLEAAIPKWMPDECLGAIGIINHGDRILPFNKEFPGILVTGNAVIRRKLFDKVGLFATELGRKGNGSSIFSGEDTEMYERFLGVGAKGLYLPELKVHHYIPAERLTKDYLRRWKYGHGISSGVWDKKNRQKVAYLFGIPRYLIGDIFKDAKSCITKTFGNSALPSENFLLELKIRYISGFLYGKYLFK